MAKTSRRQVEGESEHFHPVAFQVYESLGFAEEWAGEYIDELLVIAALRRLLQSLLLLSLLPLSLSRSLSSCDIGLDPVGSQLEAIDVVPAVERLASAHS